MNIASDLILAGSIVAIGTPAVLLVRFIIKSHMRAVRMADTRRRLEEVINLDAGAVRRLRRPA